MKPFRTQILIAAILDDKAVRNIKRRQHNVHTEF